MRSLALAFLALGFATRAFAGDVSLAGVWEGSYSCKTETADGKGSFKVRPSILTILQSGLGGPLTADIDGRAYSGTVILSAESNSAGAGAFIACGTSDATTGGAFNEVETFHFEVDSLTGGGAIKTSGAYVENGVEIGVCKGSWRRTGGFGGKLAGCAP